VALESKMGEYSEYLLFSEMVSTQTLLGNITELFLHVSMQYI